MYCKQEKVCQEKEASPKVTKCLKPLIRQFI